MTAPETLFGAALFKGLPDGTLSALAIRGRTRYFPADAVLMEQGEVSNCMHIIVSGRVLIERSHPALPQPVLLANIGPGEVVGEMGLFDGQPRSATVTAAEATETLELGAAVVAQTLLEAPEVATALLSILSQRLRTTDALVAEAIRKGWLDAALNAAGEGPTLPPALSQ